MKKFDFAFANIRKLVKTFQENEAKYKKSKLSEAAVRKDFIDKFWHAMDWDVNHDYQTNPYEQEVRVEKQVISSGASRRADYAFYLGPNFHDVKFFVEAKRPFSDLATNENYFQLIRYAWNSHAPLAVLMDFEQLHILDCRYKPDLPSSLNRLVKKFHYTEYADRERFAEIYWFFSREAVKENSIEKRAKDLPKPRGKAVQRGLFAGGYQTIDESFLAEFDEYRGELARAFKRRNPSLDGETLTELAQRTLDRLVFLRFLEDKGIEAQRQVENFGDNGTAWEDFVSASRRLDSIYNGVVYKQHSILDSPKFKVDDKMFAHICEQISPMNSAFDFNAIPIHILGSIYERFLGKVIVTDLTSARVEDKPEVRRAGGVYYTPEYIVRYIVENTVGKLIKGKTPGQIAEMRFADISCGSGSFLLGVFDLLLKYHTQYYTENSTKVRRDDFVKRDSVLYPSLKKKREILLNNIFGVDIDNQAVEVCQLSLYLKLLQEETEASTHQYLLDFAHETDMRRLLPDLSQNIVCGNSLIGTDVLDGDLFAGDKERKLNPINFTDAFPSVMKQGGFDAIVGNPPYVSNDTIPDDEKPLYQQRYRTGKRFDLYQCFMERAIEVLRKNGRSGMILPNTFLTGRSYASLRNFLLSSVNINEIVDLPQGVFKGVVVDNVLFFASISDSVDSSIAINLLREKSPKERVASKDWDASYIIPQKQVARTKLLAINLALTPELRKIFEQIESSRKVLGDCFDVCDGLIPYKTSSEASLSKYTGFKKHDGWGRLLRGKDIGRYEINWRGEYIKYGDHLWCRREERFFTQPKILLHSIRNKSLQRRLVGSIDYEQFYNTDNLINIIQSERSLGLEFLLGLLNSRLINFWYKQCYPNVNINPNELRSVPLPRSNKVLFAKVTSKVSAILESKGKLASALTDRDRTYFANKCFSLDHQIDRLVYELYGLEKEQIDIVEESMKGESKTASLVGQKPEFLDL